MEYYVSIYMSVMLIIIALIVTTLLYVIPALIKCKWPNTNIKMGIFYSLIIATWLAIGWLLLAPTNVANADFDNAYGYLKQKEYTKALEGLKPLAEQDHVPSQINLGRMYHKGLGVEIDYKTAIKYYEMAANQGDNKDAQHTLGNLYRNGQGEKNAVAQDLNKALHYYEKASDNGFPYSMYTIGVMYAEGEGVNKSIKNSTKWLKKTYEHDSIKKKILGLWDSFRIAFLIDDFSTIHDKYQSLSIKSLEIVIL